MSNLNAQQRLRDHCLGPQKGGPRGNPYTAVVLYVVPNHLETLQMAGVFVHLDSPGEDSQTTGAPRNIRGGLLGSPETLNAWNNSEVSVNKQAGNLPKYKDKWSLITKNHLVLEIAKIDFRNDSPHVQTCPQCELQFSEQASSVIDAELSKLLSQGVIMCVIYCKNQCLSIFS